MDLPVCKQFGDNLIRLLHGVVECKLRRKFVSLLCRIKASKLILGTSNYGQKCSGVVPISSLTAAIVVKDTLDQSLQRLCIKIHTVE